MKVLSSRLLPPPPPDKPRSGVHLSDVIKYILIKKNKERYGGKVNKAARLRWESGNAWERLFSRALAAPAGYGKLVAQDTIVKDDIEGNPDYRDIDNNIIIESKWTMLSAAHAVESPAFWPYLVQIKGYCWMWDTDRGDLIVFHTMGDYNREKGLPEPVAYQHALRFNADELRRNWAMLLVNRDAMVKEGKRKS